MNLQHKYEIIGIEDAANYLPPKNHVKRERIRTEHAELIARYNEMNVGQVMMVRSPEKGILEKLRTDLRSAQVFKLLNAPLRTFLHLEDEQEGYILGIIKTRENDKTGKT